MTHEQPSTPIAILLTERGEKYRPKDPGCPRCGTETIEMPKARVTPEGKPYMKKVKVCRWCRTPVKDD